MTDWQDISTAPRDGRKIIVLVNGEPTIAQWVEHRMYQHCWAWMVAPLPSFDFLHAVDPTEWMPLPEPPKEVK